ncbi:MAG: hypothetical protein ACLUNZ_10880 [Evtepia sp.]
MPNLFTKVKDRARAAAQPKPRTTHQVRGQVDTPFLLLTVLLVVVGARHAALGLLSHGVL